MVFPAALMGAVGVTELNMPTVVQLRAAEVAEWNWNAPMIFTLALDLIRAVDRTTV